MRPVQSPVSVVSISTVQAPRMDGMLLLSSTVYEHAPKVTITPLSELGNVDGFGLFPVTVNTRPTVQSLES